MIGIDSGKKGAFIVINDEGKMIDKMLMPVLENEYDTSQIVSFMEKYKEHTVIIEKIGVIYGVGKSVSFQMGYGLALIIGIASALKMRIVEVSPRRWQQSICSGVSAKKAKTKSKIVFKREFPELIDEFKITDKGNKSKNIHDGLIDARLIAEYGYRKIKH